MLKPIAFLLGLFCGSALLAAPAATLRPLELKDAVLTRDFQVQGESAAVSPDGRWVAYTLAEEQRPPKSDDDIDQYTKTGLNWNDVGGTIWLMDVKSGKATNITVGAKGTSWNPTWSPDGKQLAFFSDRDGAARLWLWDRATGQTKRVSEAPVRSFFVWIGVRWLPDNKHVVLHVLPEGYTVAQANELLQPSAASAKTAPTNPADNIFPGSAVSVYRNQVGNGDPKPAAKAAVESKEPAIEPMPKVHRYFGDVVLMDVQTGQIVRRLTKDLSVTHYRLSPDGKQLFVTHMVGTLKNTQESLSSLRIVDIATGQSRALAQNVALGFGTTASWSPDGKKIAYVTYRQIAPSGLFVVDAAGGAPRQLGKTGEPDFKNGVRAPLWTPASDAVYAVSKDRQLWKGDLKSGTVSRVAASFAPQVINVVADGAKQGYWSPDNGRSLYAEFRDPVKATSGVVKIDTAGGGVKVLRDEHKEYGGDFQPALVSADGKTVVFNTQGAQQGSNLWIAGVDYAGARQLTQINPELEKYVFGAGRIIEYKGARGDALRGALLLPAGYKEGQRYPLLTRLYPGPYKQADKVNRFGLEGTGFSNMQMFATRGYAVYFPEIPQRLGSPMKDLADGALAAIDKVVELGIADPDRLGVFGQSYGGYSTISTIVQTNRFKGAMMSAGMADLVSGYGQFYNGSAGGIGWSETGQGLMGGTPWEHHNRYIENSPIFRLDRVTTPLLIIHGDRDNTVPVWQGDAIFVGLRRLGKEVEFRRYKGEEHTIRSLENMSDYWSAAIRWMDTHVKGAKPAAVASAKE